MEDVSKLPQAGEFYRYSKGGLYQIVAVATGAETGEQLVIYQALQDDFKVYAKPLEQFLDGCKNAQDCGCFEKVEREALFNIKAQEVLHSPATLEENRREQKNGGPNPLFLQFLDSDDREERLELLQRMKGEVGQKEVDSLCVVLDVQASDGPVDDQLEDLIRYLKMQLRYDAPRLRRG